MNKTMTKMLFPRQTHRKRMKRATLMVAQMRKETKNLKTSLVRKHCELRLRWRKPSGLKKHR